MDFSEVINRNNSMPVILLLLLLACAIEDWKHGRIPNQYLVWGIAVRGMFYLYELGTDGMAMMDGMILDFVWCMLVCMMGIAVRMMTRGGLGMGDIKLFGVMMLYLSVEEWMEAIFFGSLLGLLGAMVIQGRRKEKKKFPFAPAIFFGTILSMII